MTYSLQRQLAWQIEAKYGGYGGKYCPMWLQYSLIGQDNLLREPYVMIHYDLPIPLNTMLPTVETAQLYNQSLNQIKHLFLTDKGGQGHVTTVTLSS
jgi:hypothetical protein